MVSLRSSSLARELADKFLTEEDNMAPIRILIVDDHPVVRLGIRHLLDSQSDICVVGEAGDGFEALRLAKELHPDVILLDMEMPGMNGNQVVRQMQADGLHLPVLALSAHNDRQYIQEILSNGAAGYLIKEEVPAILTEAIRGVARGEQGWVSRSVAVQLTAWMREDGNEDSSWRNLTPRELEVLNEVAGGKTNQEVAFNLKISEKTVEKHLRGIFTKLRVESRVEAAVRAYRLGIIKESPEHSPLLPK
jgi:DNA-binding NarL/FixJ family response regulator